MEKGSGLTPNHSRTQPADILALNWGRERHAQFNVTITSPLSVVILLPEASMLEGAAALEAEAQQHIAMIPRALS